jgi:hypothetical protein
VQNRDVFLVLSYIIKKYGCKITLYCLHLLCVTNFRRNCFQTPRDGGSENLLKKVAFFKSGVNELDFFVSKLEKYLLCARL